MKCRKCGHENPQEAQFCGQCGEKLAEQRRGKRKWIILTGCIVAAAAVAVAAYLAVFVRPVRKYEHAISTAQKYMEAENYEEAIAAYQEAIEVEPKKIEIYENLADAYVKTNDETSAEKTYDQAVQVIKKEYTKEKTVLSGAYSIAKKATDYYGKKGNLDKVKTVVGTIGDILEDSKEKTELQKLKDYYLMNWQYYKLLKQTEKDHGVASVQDDKNGTICLNGMCFAKLIDFDADGQEELLMTYLKDEQNYSVEVYAYENGKIKKVYTNSTQDIDDGGKYCVLTKKENQYYLETGTVIHGSESYDFWGYKNGRFTSVKKFGYEENDDITIDGKKVDYATWSAEYDQWATDNQCYQVLSWYQMDSEKAKLLETLDEKQQTVGTLEKRLLIKANSEKDNDTEKESDQTETQEEAIQKKLVGKKWEFGFAKLNGENVSGRDLYGSMLTHYGSSMTFTEDGKFEYYIDDEGGEGNYKISGNKIIVSYRQKYEGGQAEDFEYLENVENTALGEPCDAIHYTLDRDSGVADIYFIVRKPLK